MNGLVAILPLVIFAVLCPLMMLFMMRGGHGGHGSHGGHGEHTGHDQAQDQDATAGDDARLRRLQAELDALRRGRAGS